MRLIRSKTLVFTLWILGCFVGSSFGQAINVTNVTTAGRFTSCTGTINPTVTATLISGPGVTVTAGGSLVCTDPCLNTTVRLTVSNLFWNQSPGAEWLHGIVFPTNPGVTVTPVTIPANLITFGGCTGCGSTFGAGFYYDGSGTASGCCIGGTLLDGNPCNNWGIGTYSCTTPLNFSVDLTFCNSQLSGTNETFTFRGTSDGATGCWSINDTTNTLLHITLDATACGSPTPFVASAVSRTCTTAVNPNYTSTLTGSCPGTNTVTWWTDSLGGTQVGTGTPFVYDPAGSACPAGDTLWAECCPTSSCAEREMVIIPGSCNPMTVDSIYRTSCNGIYTIDSISLLDTTGAPSYNLMPGNITNTTGNFTNILAGTTYTITATDAGGCVTTTTLVLAPAPIMQVSNVTVSSACATDTLTITAINGIAPYQYNIGGPNQSSNVFANVTPGTYTITVTDAINCTATSSITLAPHPPGPTNATLVDTNVSCNGANDGSIQMTASSSLPLTYSINTTPSQTNSTGYFNNLPPGMYNVVATDPNGCSVNAISTITQPTVLNINLLLTNNPSCSPGNDGSIIVAVSGGTSPYQYNLNGGPNQSVNSFTGLGAGTYLVTVIDANGCTDTMSTSLALPPSPTISSFADTNVSCNGAGDGSAQLVAGPNVTTYTLTPGALTNSTGYFNSLGPNTYTITAVDGNGCTVSTVFTITEPNALLIDSLTTTIASCSPGNDGNIIVNISGGSPGFQFNIGGPSQTGNTFSNLSANTYLVTVTDTNGCTDTMSTNLAPPPAPMISSVVDTNVDCNGANTGSILVTATGTGQLSFTINTVPSQTNTSGYFSNLVAGSYSITVSDVNNCTVSTNVTITQPNALQIDSLTVGYPSCAPGGDGSIVVNISGGTPSFLYQLNANPSQGSNTFNNLSSAVYTVTVSDGNMCTATSTVSLMTPTGPSSVSAVDTNVSCNGANDGSVQVTAIGNSPLTFTISTVPTQTNASGYFNNLAPGLYSIVVTDTNNCSANAIANIQQPSVLNITNIAPTNPSCTPGGDGSIVVSANGGTPGYTYNIGGPNQSSNTFNNLGSSIYLVTVTDTNGCTDTMSVSLTAPNAPTITAVADTNVSCAGTNDGSIQISANGSSAITYTLNPGAVTNSTGFFNNLSPNTYTITVSDASNCTVSTVVNITAPPVLSITGLTPTNPSCSPGGDGSITIAASGGTPGFQYNIGGPNQSSNIFSNLNSGPYLVTVVDTNGCTDTMSITLVTPNAPIINSVVDTNVSCNGANDGSILISASGGSTLTYTLNPGSITNSTGYFNNLMANNYTIVVSDASNCTISTTVNITQPNALSIDSLTTAVPSCTPGNDGIIIVHASGGTPGFLYDIGGTPQINDTFNNVSSGLYLVTVTDTNGCTDTMSINLTTPMGPAITNASITNVSCNGGINGSISLSTSGGTSPITYTLNPGNVTSSSAVFTGLSANTYTIVMSDANNCTTSTVATVSQPAQLNIDSLTSTLPSCSPGNDGVIIVNASGGTMPYLYNIGGPNQTSNTFTNLMSGTYLVTVTDSNNCIDAFSINLSTPNPPVILGVNSTNVTCNGSNNGSISISGSASSTITYTLNPGAVSNTTGNFINLAPNSYVITLTDASNCSATTSVNISQPPALIIDSLTASIASCSPGNDASVIIHASGGTTPLQYNIGGPNQSSNSFTNLASGIYLVTVTDFFNCTDTMSINLSAPNAPVITSVVDTNVSCNGAGDGSIQISGTGASALTYTLNPGAVTNSTGYFNNLVPNSYTITLSDASNCTVSTTVVITEPPVLNIDSLTSSLPTCSPGNDGSVVVHGSGGTSPYVYNVGGPNQSSNTFTNLASGIYLVTLTDSNGCTDTMSVDLSAPNAPVITSYADTNVSCNGAGDGSVQLTATGSSAITYTLTPGAVTNSSGYFNNLGPGSYTIVASDASNCTVSTSVTITEPAILDITSLTSGLPSCSPGNDGFIIVNVSGGTTPYQYNVGGPNQGSNSFLNLASGIYLVTVTDTNGCTDTMSINLSAPNAPVITSVVDTNVSCNGAGDGSIQISGTGASALTYTLNPGAVTNSTGYFNNLVPNSYTITLSDASNCTVSTTVVITEPPVLNIDSLTSSLPTCSPGNDGSVVVHGSGGTSPYVYNVGGPNQSSNTFTNLASGIYLVTLTDSNGCTDTMSVDLSAPNAPVITSYADTNVSCNGAGDGSVQLTATGSSAITYTLTPGAVTNSSGYFNNLGPGSYTIVASDASNCTVSTSVTITEPAILDITSLTSGLPSCSPGNDGFIIVNVSGGTTPYQYNVGGPNQGSNSFLNLASGIYLVTVTDTNGCTDTMSINLSAPNAPVITSVVDTNVSCNGAGDGSIQISGTGASALTYTLNPGAVTNSTGYFNNLVPNSYTITLSDASNCTVSTTVVITEPPVLNIDSLTSVLPTCSPGNDGSVVVHGSGGTSPYVYNVGGPNQSSNTFSNLASGIYLVTLTDSNGCTDTMSVDLSAPNAPVITSYADTNVSCNGAGDGSVQLTATGSSAITYTLTPGAVTNSSGYFNNLGPGSYTIVASDASNCTVSTSVTITEPAILDITSLTSGLPSCSPGNDGFIIVNVSGGTTPYQYNVGGPNQGSNSFLNLASGIYLVTVTDTNGCTDTMSINLSAPNAPVITSVVDTNVSCNGAGDGSIQISGTGASALTYTLNPGAVTNSTGYFNNLVPNSYTITLSDASNCTVSTTVVITEPPVLNIDSLTSSLPTCSPGNDGSVVVHGSGGTSPYVYNVGGPNQSSNTFTNLASGIYLVTLTDSNGCTDTMSVDLSAPNAPVITSYADTNVSCNGAGDGSVQLTATGSSAITYTLTPGAVTNSSGYFNNLGPGSYTIVASDASNCTVSTSVTITEPAILDITSLTSGLPSCSPGNDGFIIVNVSGGTTPYQYNVGGPNQGSNSFLNLASGIYLVTVTDTNGCTDTMSINLSAPNAPVITSVVDTNVSCNGAGDGSIQISGTGASALTYTLNPGAVTNSTGYFNNLVPNSYTITLSDASNCTVSTTVVITEPPVLNIDSLTSSLPTCSPGNDGSVVVHGSGGTSPYVYNVGGPNQSSNTFTNLASGIYLVTLTDSNGCTDTMSVDLSAPNAPVITSYADTNVSCNGAGDGSVQLTATGSSAITYTLTPGAVTNSSGYFNNLGPGSYTIVASDASNCTVSTSVTITEPAILDITSLTSGLPSCSPGNDGFIIVNVSGGTTPYQYNVGGPNQGSNSFLNLASGIYLVTVTDTNGCTDTDEY